MRIVLAAEDFEPWRLIVASFPGWTPDQVARLERAAAGKSRPQDWRCRAEPLAVGRWLSIETRSYTDKVWRPLSTPWFVMPFDQDSLGVQIGSKVYVSTQSGGPFGSFRYMPIVLDAEAAA